MTPEKALLEMGRPFYIIATGGGAGLQGRLWNVCDISHVLLGAEFPYACKETSRSIGFNPNEGASAASYSSPEVAVDLATTAYLKGLGNHSEPIGLGLTASVASSKMHRGEHRAYSATVSREGCFVSTMLLEKGVGGYQRLIDGGFCDDLGLLSLLELGVASHTEPLMQTFSNGRRITPKEYHRERRDDLFVERFFAHPYFTAQGKRLEDLPEEEEEESVLFPGTFNPPTYGHFGMADSVKLAYCGRFYKIPKVIFQIAADPPHKEHLTEGNDFPVLLLKRAYNLQGRDRMFVRNQSLYLDKIHANPERPFLLGADALLEMFNPKWGVDLSSLLNAALELGVKFFVADRLVGGVMTTLVDCLLQKDVPASYHHLFYRIAGRWDVSSTEIRERLKS